MRLGEMSQTILSISTSSYSHLIIMWPEEYY
jgi:hypothetical protein